MVAALIANSLLTLLFLVAFCAAPSLTGALVVLVFAAGTAVLGVSHCTQETPVDEVHTV